MAVLLLGQLREVSGRCLEHQKSLLIKLNHSLITQNDSTNDLNPRRLAKWDFSRDCCGWPGVTCSRDGYVTGLDLSFEGIEDGLNNSSPLFELQYLTSLNLANHTFHWRPDMSSGFERLGNMMHLDMSLSYFIGRFPIEISNMTRLVSLDLSSSYHYSYLPDAQFNLRMLIGNMSKLTELRLDWVHYLGLQESDWSQVLSSSLPHLQVLSLQHCQLSGSIPSSLSKLTSLTSLDLSYNSNLSGSIPSSLGELKMLSVLELPRCNLQGFIPNSLAKLTTLTYIDLSYNQLSGTIPNSFAKLTTLTDMDLSWNQLSGTIPNSFAELTTFTYMDLSFNQLSGTIPSLSRFKNLTHLNLGYNQLTGSILGTQWSDLSQLEYINFDSNSLSGSIPTSLFGIPTLTWLSLFNNSFVNFTDEPVNTSSSSLHDLDLSDNELQGLFPSFVFGLKALQSLWVDSNNFSGIFYMDSLRQLRNLSDLKLSYNNFSIELGEDLQNFAGSLSYLGLASCKLKVFPKFLKSNTKYTFLDLSANEIRGEIPVWIWNILEFRGLLDLAHNQLETFELPVGHFYHPEALSIHLSSNKLHGSIPKFSAAYYLELSNNMFDSTIFSGINMLTSEYLYASNNRLQGSISESLCNNDILKFLDLSNNFLTGILPACLTQMPSLILLNLKNNSISGTIPDSFPLGCNLHSVILSSNSLLGSIPKSLGNCTNLELLDLGNNKLHEDFPCRASNISESLWSGALSVLDLSNNFLGGIFPSCLPQMPRLKFLSLKNNNIEGMIPDSFPSDCNLQTVILNGNSLLGNIPKSLGKCSSLEVLDIGNNKLHDGFPCWMSDISTLQVLVLKSNMLEGSIICPSVNVSWPSLQILDIASNNFNGSLPSIQLLGWNSMILHNNSSFLDHDFPHYIKLKYALYSYYNNYNVEITLGLTLKGYASIQKIFASLALIDLSDNAFEGSIPTEFGYFTALYSLNLSNNALRGQIPSSLGNMKNLESLDLQKNQLTGMIPVQLAHLNFLSVLNLSFNQLEGMIPKGGQLQTFSNDSFMHNKGLCGFPLNKNCEEKDEATTLPKPAEKFTRDVLISAEVGYAVGLGFIIMPLIFWPKWRMRFFQFIDRILPHSWRS